MRDCRMAKAYETVKVAVDLVMFTIYQDRLKVLLHTREKEPFKGAKELPGGLLLPNETAEETLKRKYRELVGGADAYMKQFHTFTKPDRDPRGRTVSIGFISLVDDTRIKEVVQWYDYATVDKLAFDHKMILDCARRHLKANVDQTIIKQFMSDIFPLNQLQRVHEILEEMSYDNRNFRKKMLVSGLIEEMDQMQQNVSHRPAKLFRFC